jgi:hypothetical protein
MRRILDLYDRPSAGGRVVCIDEFGPLNLQPRLDCNQLSFGCVLVLGEQPPGEPQVHHCRDDADRAADEVQGGADDLDDFHVDSPSCPPG